MRVGNAAALSRSKSVYGGQFDSEQRQFVLDVTAIAETPLKAVISRLSRDT